MARYPDADENPETQILHESNTHATRYYSPTPSPVIRLSGFADNAASKGSQLAANGFPMNSIIKRTHAALFGGSGSSPTPPTVMSDFGEVEILEVATPQPHPFARTPSAAGQSGPPNKNTCVFATCARSTNPFGTMKDLKRHIINVHHIAEEDAIARIAARTSKDAEGSREQAPTPIGSKGVVGNSGGSVLGRNNGWGSHKAAAYTDEETLSRAPGPISEPSASENGFASPSKIIHVQDPHPAVDLRCLLSNCPGHAGHYSSLKNLKRHWQDVHKLSVDEIASRVAKRENAELSSEEDITAPALEQIVSSTPETVLKRKKVRDAVHRCVVLECPRSSEGFGERYDLKRHLSTVHKMSTEDAAKIVAEQDFRREEISKQPVDVILVDDFQSTSGEPRTNENAFSAVDKNMSNTPVFRVSGSNRASQGDYGREYSAKSAKQFGDMRRQEYSFRADRGSFQSQQQVADDEDDGILYPETITLPESRTAACSKIQSMDIVRKIKLRSGKVLRGLAKGQSNLESVMAQQRGDSFQGEDACRHCQLFRGPFEECVVLKGALNHSCTNCHYNSEGSRCSFRQKFEAGGSQLLTVDNDELAMEGDSITLDIRKDRPSLKRPSVEAPVEEEEADDESFQPYTPEYYTAQYANISEEERLQEESVLHMRLSCLAQARIQNISKRRYDSEQHDENSYISSDGRPKGKRARRSH